MASAKSLSIVLGGLMVAGPAAAQTGPASVGELLKKVRNGWSDESAELKKREAEFVRDKNTQAKKLADARRALAAEEKRGETLEAQFEENEKALAELEETLRIRLGTLGELFGVVRASAGEANGLLQTSLTSAQYPGRAERLKDLAASTKLPSVDQLETLWFLLSQELVASGEIVKFEAPVDLAGGEEKTTTVARIGPFTAVSDGKYFVWDQKLQKLQELGRQPAGRFLADAQRFESASSGVIQAAIDPSQGTLLSLLVSAPTVSERLAFGGLIGYIILGLGAVTFLVAVARLVMLFLVATKVRAQRNSSTPKEDNPLGRIMAVHSKNPNLDKEALEAKLDEAIIREASALERFLWAIKVVAGIAPLMGLLGTVTGMIETFQTLTLFGTGDPKQMAGGISEALVTTMLGLVVAIPLVLMHSWLSSISRNLVDVLTEQSAGIIAERADEREAA
ncbi:MAG: MotA/TolQ/ExbB proton channel family protein [Myxococcota bacterium]